MEKKSFQLSFERRELASWSENGQQTRVRLQLRMPVADGA